jgi:hypothetical protein
MLVSESSLSFSRVSTKLESETKRSVRGTDGPFIKLAFVLGSDTRLH